MKKIEPLEVFLWTFRRNDRDIINLYNSLSDLMKIATGGDMLNFGYWENDTTPILAQKKLCSILGKMAKLENGQHVIDVGSGFASPAFQWLEEFNPKKITCINLNFSQLKNSFQSNKKNEIKTQKNLNENLNFLNATATYLPIFNESADRIVALESAQHFKPLGNFLSESHRILKKDGILALAIPVLVKKYTSPMMKLGLLSITWSSEHYTINFIESLIKKHRFHIDKKIAIGSNVYEPMTKYYLKNREFLKTRIKKHYPSYVEKILFKSLLKMSDVSKKKIIDYFIFICKK